MVRLARMFMMNMTKKLNKNRKVISCIKAKIASFQERGMKVNFIFLCSSSAIATTSIEMLILVHRNLKG